MMPTLRLLLNRRHLRWLILGLALISLNPGQSRAADGRPMPSHTAQAKVFLAAGDYRHALQACEELIRERPSAAGYVYLTYVYQAIDGYLEHLSRAEQWGLVDQLYFNLAYKDPQDLVDPPGGMARMAKEMIQTSVRQQSDVSAAMATRLDRKETERLWKEQAAWRGAKPDGWWTAAPPAWQW
ncbi:MAG: hypothetical protein FJ245_05865 [Nitrospira sp.]|nr:hypothetical protein [Nitrospira sp.]